jgi:hypothetical protein
MRPTGPSPRLREWLRSYGIRRLARQLRVDRRTVYRWFNGAARPHVDNAIDILMLARASGTDLGWEDVFGELDGPLTI